MGGKKKKITGQKNADSAKTPDNGMGDRRGGRQKRGFQKLKNTRRTVGDELCRRKMFFVQQ